MTVQGKRLYSGVSVGILASRIYDWAKGKGWWGTHEEIISKDLSIDEIGTKLLLATGELNEGFEELRNGHDEGEIYYKDGKPEGFPIEIADSIIRLLDLSARLGIDIEEAIAIKMAYNETRPHRHGGKLA